MYVQLFCILSDVSDENVTVEMMFILLPHLSEAKVRNLYCICPGEDSDTEDTDLTKHKFVSEWMLSII